MHFSIIVPTLNAGTRWDHWIEALKKQTLQPQTVLIIDSSSDDQTVQKSRAAGFDVRVISRPEFNHGATRQWGVECLPQSEIIVFLTQDAVFADPYALERIVSGFMASDVGVVYGRQLPNSDASLLASHARLFNYPATSHVSSLVDCKKFGVRTAFNSNSFAAYRLEALDFVHGFPRNVIVSEDVYVAAKMLLHDWKIVYCAEARVHHSHNFSFWQEFQRYFDIGVFYARETWLAEKLGHHEGEGMRFLKSEWSYLLKKAPYRIPESVLRTGIKYLGYRLGKMERLLPLWLKRFISMQKSFWEKPRSV